jgi:hypothetical protein
MGSLISQQIAAPNNSLPAAHILMSLLSLFWKANMLLFDTIWYIQLQLDCQPVAVVRYTFTHKQYIEQHNRHKQYIELKPNSLHVLVGVPPTKPDNILSNLLNYLETRTKFLLGKVVTDLHLNYETGLSSDVALF